jgi:hypothetical protein
VDPVLGGEVVERQQHVAVAGDLRDRLEPLRAVAGGERLDGLDRVVLVLGVVDLRERSPRARMCVAPFDDVVCASAARSELSWPPGLRCCCLI